MLFYHNKKALSRGKGKKIFFIFVKKGLTKETKSSIIGKYEISTTFAALAQLDRVFGYEPKGQGFESLAARQ